MARVVIVGGGIAGLATARFLRAADPAIDVRVLEAAPRAGGKVFTERLEVAGGLTFLAEHGPNGFLDSEPATLELTRLAGLDGSLLRSNDAARRRSVYLRGRLRPVPTSPPAFLTTSLLSWRGKARVLGEWFVKPASPELAARETVAAFARRRFGAEAHHALVEPFVHGVFAGDPEALELASALPRLATFEREHGGLLRALAALEGRRRAAARAGSAAGAPVLTSLRDGMGTLPAALACSLGDGLVLRARVRAIARRPEGYAIAFERSGVLESLPCDVVVLALPALDAAPLVAPLAPEAANVMGSIDAVPIAVVALGFAAAPDAKPPLDGFGFLSASGERLRALGAIAESNTWPRGGEGFLARVLFGGAGDRGALDLSDDALIAAARQDLQRATGFAGAPAAARVARWPAAIPQYAVGHAARVAAIEGALSGLPGLVVTGASYRGVALNDLCREAKAVAARIAASLRARTR